MIKLVRRPALLPLLLLAGCASDRFASAEGIATPAGLRFQPIEVGQGEQLASWRRIRDPAQPLQVYIEGDGLAWAARTRPSADPTPRHPLGLTLAAADPATNVVYLARPCMYQPTPNAVRCTDPARWTDDRFDEASVALLNVALDRMKASSGQPVHLIGYSGGAAVAVALAARRSDVVSLRTVAGNLDPAGINRLHNVSPQPSALDIAGLAPRLSRLPQIHFSGSRDEVVPPSIAGPFVARAGRCAVVVPVAAGHESGWAEAWPALLRHPLPAC